LCSAARATPGLIELHCTLGAAGQYSIIADDRDADDKGDYSVEVRSR
jgi:hypothetical protein